MLLCTTTHKTSRQIWDFTLTLLRLCTTAVKISRQVWDFTIFNSVRLHSDLRFYSLQLCTIVIKISLQVWDFTLFNSVRLQSRFHFRFEILLASTLYDYNHDFTSDLRLTQKTCQSSVWQSSFSVDLPPPPPPSLFQSPPPPHPPPPPTHADPLPLCLPP